MLFLSTGHLSETTARMLDNTPVSDWPVTGYTGTYGWVISANYLDFTKNAPEDLVEAIFYARSKECSYILFDRDEEPTPDLPYYNW